MNTLASMANLGPTWEAQDRAAEAISLMEKLAPGIQTQRLRRKLYMGGKIDNMNLINF